jgi:hypothetical protein
MVNKLFLFNAKSAKELCKVRKEQYVQLKALRSLRNLGDFA